MMVSLVSRLSRKMMRLSLLHSTVAAIFGVLTMVGSLDLYYLEAMSTGKLNSICNSEKMILSIKQSNCYLESKR